MTVVILSNITYFFLFTFAFCNDPCLVTNYLKKFATE